MVVRRFVVFLFSSSRHPSTTTIHRSFVTTRKSGGNWQDSLHNNIPVVWLCDNRAVDTGYIVYLLLSTIYNNQLFVVLAHGREVGLGKID
jgi:hypothetical protein